MLLRCSIQFQEELLRSEVQREMAETRNERKN